MMERLTEKRDGQNVIPLRQDGKHKWSLASAGMGDASTQFLYGEFADKLAQYECLEEQGLLLRLPIEAYFIKDNIVRKGWVQELVYSPCRKLLLDIRYNDNSLDSYRGYVGNTVFLTKEEAEQKLKEMESDMPTVEEEDGTIRPMWLEEIAEQLKAGGENG